MDARSRSFNLIRGKLVNLRRDRQWRMIGFVSAAPSVGKSYVSANVAAALSRDPRWNTYLVDLDLRRGGVASTFGLQPEAGLETYLEDPAWAGPVPSFAPLGQQLVLITTVPGHLHSAELLASSRASALLAQMRRSAGENLFLFDLPPVFANDDASNVVELLDGYVFVAEEGKTTRREIESAVQTLGEERLAGIILNKYRGGLISEGRGIEERYASGYYSGPGVTSSEQSPADTRS
jgi:Mrp family chromosome partitioning ATPase